MGFHLNSFLGRGSRWPSAFEDAGLSYRKLPVDAGDQPLFLTYEIGLDTWRTLDEIALDEPDLRGRVSDLQRLASDETPLALIGAEFFAGLGFQWAAAWAGGRLVFGPVITANHWSEVEDERFVVASERSGMAINRLLRWIRVESLDGHDEFDSAVIDESHQRK